MSVFRPAPSTARLLAVLVACALAAPAGSAASAPPAAPQDGAAGRAATAKRQARQQRPSDVMPNPLAERQHELKQDAIAKVLRGEVKPQRRGASTVVRLDTKAEATRKAGGRPQAVSGRTTSRPQAGTDLPAEEAKFVELARERTDRVFVLLVDFGDQRHPDYPDQDTQLFISGPTRFDGPRVNQLPKPNRLVDNTTIWQANYDPAHYERLYFDTTPGADSVANYFLAQSSGRYGIEGEVTDWVRVPYNQARYGRSNGFPCVGAICSNTWALIDDGLAAWVEQQRQAGKTTEEIRERLATYDVWDRYDADDDGNFNEPDGYIDHFQVVHAGSDQAVLNNAEYGEDAIWSHRWYAHIDQVGETGPPSARFGGTEVGDTGIWAGDYTVQPENGGLGVFAHEFGHDLNLVDLYDTTGLAEGPTGFWELYSAGTYLGTGREAIGNRPGDMGAWSKLQLGWLDYEVAYEGQRSDHVLGPVEGTSENAQALAVILPEKRVSIPLGTPPEGTRAWWGGKGDDLNASLTRLLSLPAGKPATLEFKTWFDTERGFDLAYVQVNDGFGWVNLANNLTDPATNNGISGRSLTWRDARFDLAQFAGKTVLLRLLYVTDSSIQSPGFMADAISVRTADGTLFSDGAESGANGWLVSRFKASTGVEHSFHPGFYLAEYRTYTSFDQTLRTGPYNFGFSTTRPLFVDHFPYQDGLLVWYWDTSHSDNDVSLHPCEGMVLAVDAHPKIMKAPNGGNWRERIQLFDATFGLQDTDRFKLHLNSVEQLVRSKDANRVFDDTRNHCMPELPSSGVALPRTGVTLTVRSQTPTQMEVSVADRKNP